MGMGISESCQASSTRVSLYAFIDNWNDHPVPFTWTKEDGSLQRCASC